MENDGAGIEEEQPVGPLSDDDLMTSFQQGNLNAFVELLERHQNDVFAYCYRILQDRGAAGDIAQDVFVKLYQSVSTYKPAGLFRSYLFRIARNAIHW